jgi:hypothetical protein
MYAPKKNIEEAWLNALYVLFMYFVSNEVDVSMA